MNVRPGTTVDHGIGHAFEMDWYTVSHGGRLGTSKPMYCHVLCDENGLSPDELQLLAFHMCFACCRCTMPIGYPAPAYYAHLLGDRAKKWLHDSDVDRFASTSTLPLKSLHCQLVQ